MAKVTTLVNSSSTGISSFGQNRLAAPATSSRPTSTTTQRLRHITHNSICADIDWQLDSRTLQSVPVTMQSQASLEYCIRSGPNKSHGIPRICKDEVFVHRRGKLHDVRTTNREK